MNGTKTKLALMGFGFMGRIHARNITSHPDADLVAAFSALESDRAEIERLGARFYSDWRELIADEPADAVVVATPTFTHGEMALAAFDRGLHVFLEKPMERSSDAAARINAAARKKGLSLGLGHVLRFDGEYVAIKEQATSGAVGAKMARCTRRGPPPGWASWFLDEEKSGTVILDLSIHDIDFMCWLAGKPPAWVSAEASPIPSGGKPFFGISHVVLDFGPGDGLELGFAEASWAAASSYPFSTSIEIAGKSGLIACSIPGKHPLETYTASGRVATNAYERDGYYNEIDDFIKSIAGGRPPKVTGEDGLLAVRTCLAALESAKRHETIAMEGFP
ncbi:MAG: Gfo/Idh/MocA family oxidoreductase [Candidatus Lokiarchaeota archaeon]|nr:Gfo/Idh/MocA family oxidoreductase [Candidatus Lokiarchaeota archaeon]